ncbi:MAG: pyridoxal phosphate synthase yaaE subunit, glutamine amidotransferase [Candidatus Peregrinibacteria bacterium GW2011_GWF2_33_10]|nr:MAG: pyridoxal phosphate synthase yaaE subunit, glutamine amidotransferase [Candidatus Peregrinibacteria bacterium GW2011_GWF2_33_10]OGJ44626.1 MAG: glutamine amidotransferase subunit PdxT [Candidatus Peregrinibacteria bacterium RIFOXYA2_FULL_33_21]OGJ46428.1 MAG: glutamine amidotransferase subunit PdxT [Candidatus Peregrinibacteria bacterium RIFOXYA12_FULL_33_12]OGJ50261.1 MAG: glutamine amidotransferase subunit PdxT [Candidatus Peregrinibacteria bacterium RIFOXYB2_FULL_33_20]
MNFKNLCIGVLGIHGSVEEHLESLRKCGMKTLRVKTKEDLEKIDGLILPGGESTTIGKLMNWYGLDKVLKDKIKKGLPVYGTCAGAILLAKKITGPQKAQSLKLMDIETERNAYGRQTDSFETEVDFVIPVETGILSLRVKDSCFRRNDKKVKKIPAIFIRAPRIKKIGKNVKILATFKNEPVLVQEKNMLAGTFHPELSDDLTVHKYFIDLCEKNL